MKLLFWNITHGLISNNFIIYRIHYIRLIENLFNFMIHSGNSLNFLIILLPFKKSDLSTRTLRLVHIVPQQSHKNLFVCSVHCFNYLVSQFEMFIHVFRLCRYQHWGPIFCSSEVFAALTSRFLNRINWLKSAYPFVKFWTSRNSLLSSFLNTLRFTTK